MATGGGLEGVELEPKSTPGIMNFTVTTSMKAFRVVTPCEVEARKTPDGQQQHCFPSTTKPLAEQPGLRTLQDSSSPIWQEDAYPDGQDPAELCRSSLVYLEPARSFKSQGLVCTCRGQEKTRHNLRFRKPGMLTHATHAVPGCSTPPTEAQSEANTSRSRTPKAALIMVLACELTNDLLCSGLDGCES